MKYSTENLNTVISTLKRVQTFALDVETAGRTKAIAVNPRLCRLTHIGIGTENAQFVLPIKSKKHDGYSIQIIAGVLSCILDDKEKTLVAHNAKFDIQVLEANGIKVRNKIVCTQVAAYIVNESRPSFALKGPRGLMMQEFKESYPSFENAVTGLFAQEMDEYLSKDIVFPLRLWKKYKKQLSTKKTGGALSLLDLFERVEMPVLRVICEMEMSGITIDVDILDDITNTIIKKQKELINLIFKDAGKEFNLRSPRDLSQILYTDLKLPAEERGIARTTLGFSTSQQEIEKFPEYPIVQRILEYRQIEKLKGTYTTALAQNAATVHNRRIHTNFNQTITSTGRLSSSGPNLQNIPTRSPLGGQIRKAFISGPGNLLIGADYSMIELRMMAHYAYLFLGWSKMGDLIKEGIDLHSMMAHRIWGVPYADVKTKHPELRSTAKCTNFGFGYGLGAQGFIKRYRRPVDKDSLDYKSGDEFFSIEEAEKFKRTYFNTYTEITKLHEIATNILQRDGVAYTITGRMRHFKDTKGKKLKDLYRDGFVAWNHNIQGSASDVIKIAMRDVHKAIRNDKELNSVKMLLQVHDELVLEAPKSLAEQVKNLLVDKMKNCVKLLIPLEVDANIGKNWAEIH